MLLLSLAVLAGITGLVSGLMVVGNGSKFEYTPNDLLNGKVNALLYIWVCISTILSMLHMIAISGFVFGADKTTSGGDITIALLANLAAGVLFTASHLYIKRRLRAGVGEKYLWGRHVTS